MRETPRNAAPTGEDATPAHAGPLPVPSGSADPGAGTIGLLARPGRPSDAIGADQQRTSSKTVPGPVHPTSPRRGLPSRHTSLPAPCVAPPRASPAPRLTARQATARGRS